MEKLGAQKSEAKSLMMQDLRERESDDGVQTGWLLVAKGQILGPEGQCLAN